MLKYPNNETVATMAKDYDFIDLKELARQNKIKVGSYWEIEGKTLICIHIDDKGYYFSFREVLDKIPYHQLEKFLEENWTNIDIMCTEMWNNFEYWYIPTEYEVFGKNEYGEDKHIRQLEYYKKQINRIKCDKNGDTCYWWNTSPYGSYFSAFCIVDRSGSAYAHYASASDGVAPVLFMRYQ